MQGCLSIFALFEVEISTCVVWKWKGQGRRPSRHGLFPVRHSPGPSGGPEQVALVLRSPTCLQLMSQVLGFFSINSEILNNWGIQVNGLRGDPGPIFVLKFDIISKS